MKKEDCAMIQTPIIFGIHLPEHKPKTGYEYLVMKPLPFYDLLYPQTDLFITVYKNGYCNISDIKPKISLEGTLQTHTEYTNKLHCTIKKENIDISDILVYEHNKLYLENLTSYCSSIITKPKSNRISNL